MPRVIQPVTMWFDLKNDPDGGRLEIQSLSPDQVAEIEDQVVTVRRYWDMETEREVPERRINTNQDKRLTFAAAVVGWENFFNEDGEPMDCTEANKQKWAMDKGIWAQFVEFFAIVQKKGGGVAGKVQDNLKDYGHWLAAVDRKPCLECKEAFRKASTKTRWDKEEPVKKEPPCATCRPELIPENMIVMAVYARLDDQWQYSHNGIPKGIPNSEIRETLDLLEVDHPEDRLEILDRLKTMTGSLIRAIDDDLKEKQRKEQDGKAPGRSGRR